jgi:hypothetical protein
MRICGHFARFAEGFADAGLFVFAQVMALEMRRIIVPGADDHRAGFGRQVTVEGFFVETARLAVHRHQEGLVAHRGDVVLEMFCDETGDFIHPLAVLEHIGQGDGAVEDAVEFFHVGHALQLRRRPEVLFHRLAVGDQVVGRQLIVQRNGGAVFDGFADGVFVEIPLGIVGAEGLEGTAAMRGAVNGRAGEAEEGGVGQRAHQVVAQVAAGGAMGFIHQHEDVGAGVQVGRDVVEFVNHREDQAARIGLEQVAQVTFGERQVHLPEADRFQVLEELALQFVAVHDEQDSGVLEGGRFEQQTGQGEHGVGLAGALRVPDQAAASLGRSALRPYRFAGARQATLHGAHLVRAQDDLGEFAIFAGRRECNRSARAGRGAGQ